MNESAFDFHNNEALQSVPRARFAAPSVASKKSPLANVSETNKTGIEGVVNPSPEAHEDPSPEGGGCRNVLSGKDVASDSDTNKVTPKRKRGRPRGAKNKAKAPKVEDVEVVKEGHTLPPQVTPTPKTPLEAVAYKKQQAEFALMSGKKKQKKEGIDEIAIEKDLLSEWLSKPEAELVDFFKCSNYHMWKDEVGMTPPSHASGKMGYYLAAFSMLRKDRYMWERMVIRDGYGEWVGIDENMLDAYVSGFFAGLGMQAHLSSLTLSRAIVDYGKKELDRLPWSQSLQYADELHQWVSEKVHVDTMKTGGYCVSSRELFAAYKVTTGDCTLSAQGFGMRASKAIQDLYSEECKRGWVRKTKNLRYTPMCSNITKSAGWMGIKLALSDLEELKVKDALGILTSCEAKKLEDYNTLNTNDTTLTPLGEESGVASKSHFMRDWD